MANYYERLNVAALVGSPIRYGRAEPWKVYAETIGRTKPSRAPQPIVSRRKKIDGRPPDTRQELHRANSKKSQVNESKPPLLNSLYLALDSLRVLASPNDASLNQSTLLTKRDHFRTILWKNKILYGDIYDPQPAISWLRDVVSSSTEEVIHFGGRIETWFQRLTQANQAGQHQDVCWQNSEGESFCSGKPTVVDLYLSLPIVLTLSLNEQDPKDWDFPATFTATSIKDDQNHEIVYDIMARIFLIDGNHFQTRYVTPTPDGQDYAIYIYDGMKNKGYAVHEPKATLATHMIGGEVITRPGESSRTHAVLYQLRGGTRNSACHARHSFNSG
ncbi:hypothetical protein F5146DRAFT_1125905 [Armillaria mellea]|nr:hypothetical protein F5146DRAFT_1125905 [Armillaria mellea]